MTKRCRDAGRGAAGGRRGRRGRGTGRGDANAVPGVRRARVRSSAAETRTDIDVTVLKVCRHGRARRFAECLTSSLSPPPHIPLPFPSPVQPLSTADAPSFTCAASEARESVRGDVTTRVVFIGARCRADVRVSRVSAPTSFTRLRYYVPYVPRNICRVRKKDKKGEKSNNGIIFYFRFTRLTRDKGYTILLNISVLEHDERNCVSERFDRQKIFLFLST